jgi:hypothetical protein
MAVARNASSSFIASPLASPVARPRQCIVELAADQFFDEPSRASPHLALDRIEPIVEKIKAISAAGCKESGFVVLLVMAWSPVRRFNAG